MLLYQNPCFNRWFFAIEGVEVEIDELEEVTILVLIDGSLQYDVEVKSAAMVAFVTILVLIDGSLQ